jgi:hypothetical protein
MSRFARRYLLCSVALLALAACGRGFISFEDRPAWRGEAEASCLKSGSVKIGGAVRQIEAINGPGMCGADFPLKVAALGSGKQALGYNGAVRPPAGIPATAQPRWPIAQQPYATQTVYPAASPAGQPQPQALRAPDGSVAAIGNGQPMTITPGNNGEPVYGAVPPPSARPGYAPAQAPMGARMETSRGAPPRSLQAPMAMPEAEADDDVPDMADDDVPDDAIVPGRNTAPATRPAYHQPAAPSPRVPQIPQLGPPRGLYTGASTPVAVTPAATLACPIVSALDQWVTHTVQPSAQRWFGQPVVEIKQISAYSCRGMNGQPGARISEHAFGNALDIAAFILADGRKIVVKKNWNGTPEEQGFLHDVQGGACETFTTVLAPGSNRYHYDHIHVDLMRRASRRLICQPRAIDGAVAAARAAGGKYAGRSAGPEVTGSIKKLVEKYAIAGEDGVFDDDEPSPVLQKRVDRQTRKK